MTVGHKWLPGPVASELSARPMMLVDIGARFGLPTHWAAVGSVLDVVAFEPDGDEARRLEAAFRRSGVAVEVVPAAVWDSEGQQTLYLTRNPGCSSLYPPRSSFLYQFPDGDRFDVVSQVDVATQLLDAALPDPVGRPCRFIKIDAQGGALAILAGAPRALGSTIGLEVEVEMAPMYEGESLFGDVDFFLRNTGFELIDLRPTYWRRLAGRSLAGTRGQLVFCDALYMVSPSVYASRVRACDEAGAARIHAAALVVCQVYGLHDWVVNYAEACRDLPDGHRPQFGALPRSRGTASSLMRNRLGQWLKDLGDRLVEASDSWAIAEQRLGNKRRLGRSVGAWMARRAGGAS